MSSWVLPIAGVLFDRRRGSRPRTSRNDAARNAIRTIYNDLLNRAWAEAKARGEKLPPLWQKNILPTVPGQQ